MKKILTLFFALGMVTVSFAQLGRSYPSQQGGSRDVILGNNNDRNTYGNNRYGTYSFSDRDRDAQIQRIRISYNQKIREVQRSRYLKNAEKRRRVKLLERQRDLEIRQVNERFNDRRNVHYGNRSHNKRY
jgi:hypothetical protein